MVVKILSLYDLPLDMKEEVLKLAREHTVTIEQAYKYYMMGGYEHGDHLCSLADMGAPDCLIEMENRAYWAKKNKKILEKIENISR